MKNLYFPILLSIIAFFSLQSCNNHKTYGELVDEENDAIHAFIVKNDIKVISKKEFIEKDSTTAENEYVLFDDNGIYMNIVYKGQGKEILPDGTYDILSRFMEISIDDIDQMGVHAGWCSEMIPRPKPERFRLRRTMMFMNAQKPGLIKDAYIYGCDSIMLDLEDAVAENQKDAARFSLYHALKTIDYGDTEVIVRINALDTPHWQEDIRVCVAGGADGIRISKCESAEDVRTVEQAVLEAEKEFGVEEGRTLLMAALESPKGILNSYEICAASQRMFGVAISGGDFRKCMQTTPQADGVDMLAARGNMLLAARAAGVQCFDTVYTNLDDEEGFRAEVLQNKAMGFDGKSLINPKQIRFVHEVFAPTEKEIKQAEKIVRAVRENAAKGLGVFTVDGKMIDIAFLPGAERTLRLAKACGMYEGDLVK